MEKDVFHVCITWGWKGDITHFSITASFLWLLSNNTTTVKWQYKKHKVLIILNLISNRSYKTFSNVMNWRRKNIFFDLLSFKNIILLQKFKKQRYWWENIDEKKDFISQFMTDYSSNCNGKVSKHNAIIFLSSFCI